MKRLKYIAFAILFLCASPVYSQIENFVLVRIGDYSGGQNSADYEDQLQINQGAVVQNAIINKKGQISIRLGQSLLVEDVGNTQFYGLGRYDFDSTTTYFVAASGTDIIRAESSDSSYTVINPSTAQTTAKNTEFIQANNELFIINGQDNTRWYDGTTFYAGGSWPTSPPTAKTGAWLNNYLFLAGNETNPDWLFISDNLDPKSFQADWVIKVNTGDGQSIKRVEPWRTNELVVYKERSIYTLNISGTAISGWTLSPLSRDVGTPATRSVVSLGNDQWFLSSEPYAVRAMLRTAFDKTLVDIKSKPIQDIFDGTGDRILNETHVDKAAAVLYDNKYILAIATGSSTVNDYVVVYDFITQSWYTIDGWYPASWVVVDGELYYADANDGRVVKCFTGSTGDFGDSNVSASGPETAIAFDYQSKVLDFDRPEYYKQLDSITLEFYPTGNYDCEVEVNLDNSGWQSAGNVNLSGNAVTLPAILPFELNSDGLVSRTLQLSKFGEFRKMQVRVKMEVLSQSLTLQKITIFARQKPWRRE